jgi:hypothetical protein
VVTNSLQDNHGLRLVFFRLLATAELPEAQHFEIGVNCEEFEFLLFNLGLLEEVANREVLVANLS